MSQPQMSTPTPKSVIGKRAIMDISHVISVIGSPSTVTKLLEHANITGVDVINPIAAIANSLILTSPQESNLKNMLANDYADKDLSFVSCNSEENREKVLHALDDVGMDTAPFTLVGDSDETEEEENPLEEIESFHREANNARSMDFICRLSESIEYFNPLVFLEDDDDEEDDDNDSIAFSSDKAVIVPLSSGNIYPHILLDDYSVMWLFFTPDSSILSGSDDGEMPHIVSLLARTNPKKHVIGSGKHLLSTNFAALSAVEGCVPGIVTVLGVNSTGASGDLLDEPVVECARWKVSHNWVQPLGDGSEGDVLESVLHTFMHISGFTKIELLHIPGKDIPVSPYPLLPRTKSSPQEAAMYAKALLESITEEG